MNRPILPNPGELVTNGKFNFGTFNSPFRNINPLDARIGEWFPYPKPLKNLRLKEWQHFALVNDDYYISLAIFDVKLLALSQVCIYERKTGEIKFYEKKTPSTKVRLPMALWHDQASVPVNGFHISVDNLLENGRHTIDFNVGPQKDLPEVKGTFTCFEDLNISEPIVVCLPLVKQRAMYSHKFVCPLEGELSIADRKIIFDRSGSYGLIDIHKGYYPYTMKWHWATAGGHNRNHQLVGFNLTNNQVKNQDAFNENCVWIDGELFLLPPVKFNFDSTDYYQPWTIRDNSNMVDLTFKPEVIRTVDTNALIIKSRYRGPFGTFSGHLSTADGKRISIDHFFGMCEDFYLRI